MIMIGHWKNIFIKYGGKIKESKINYEKDNIFRY